MNTWFIPSQFANIPTAIAHPSVNNGDLIILEGGYTETLTATITINKALTFQGTFGNIIETNTASNLPQMFNINVPWTTGKIRFSGTSTDPLILDHKKTTFTASDRIWNCAGATANVPNWLEINYCNLKHLEHAVVGNCYRFVATNINMDISNSTNNDNNGHFALTGCGDYFLFENIVYDAYVSPTNVARTRFIILGGSANYPICNNTNSTITIKNCVFDGTGQLQVGFEITTFTNWTTPYLMSLDIENNNWNVFSGTGGVCAYSLNSVSATEINILDRFDNIRFIRNNHDTNGRGMLAIRGANAISPKTMGQINGFWELCKNKISGSINLAGFSTYHFNSPVPSGNKICGVQNSQFINPYPTQNPSQSYIGCPTEMPTNYELKRFENLEKKKRTYYGVNL